MTAEQGSRLVDPDTTLNRQAPGARLHLPQGRLLDNRFEIRRRIGAGSTGAVFVAFDRERDKDIALKVFLPDLFPDERARERFLREAEATVRLSHPGIVNAFEARREGELLFITMELLEGMTLRQRLDELLSAGRAVPVDEVVQLALALCDALGFAHPHNIHGSVRPENIFLCDNGAVKLTDLGTDHLLRAARHKTFAMPMRAVPYTAPEQLAGSKDIDHRADQYSTAAVLYEMLTGAAPAGRVRPANQRRPDTPRPLSRALDRAFESDPADRFADIEAFAAALTSRSSSAVGRTWLWAGGVAMLLLIAAVATFPMWRGPVGSLIRSVRHDPEAQAAAEHARMQALASAASWLGIAKALPDDELPREIILADQAVLEGDRNLEAMAYGLAKESFHQASELYESQVTAATQLLRNEPSKVAGAARDLYERLSMLERRLHGRVAESARRVDGCEQNLRSARTDEEREAIEARKRVAETELNLMNGLTSLTSVNVFNASLRAQLTDALNQADRQLEGEQYREALASYATTKVRLEELLAWPDQAESALRRQATLSREIAQVPSALGPVALELAEVQSAFDDASAQMAQADEELAQGRLPKAIELYESAREHLSAVKVRAATGLLSRARAYHIDGKRTAAVLALDELIALDPKHQAGLQLRREIVAHRIANSIGMELVFIPPGEFLMGSPADEPGRDEDERLRPVRLAMGFYMGATEVTQSQWRAVMEDNPSKSEGDELPVEQVSWEDAVEFCRRLSREEGRRYRLPTEVEWEYACRADARSAFSFGETISTTQANYDGNYAYRDGHKGVYREATVPVAGFPASPWGLHDMHGNVWEWCANDNENAPQNEVAAAPRNGQGFVLEVSADPAQVEGRVLRGGSWRNRPRYCRCANRVIDTEGSKLSNIGFRVVMESE